MSESLHYLQQHEHDYEPSNELAQILSEKIAVPIVGPVAIGKSTVIEHVEQLDPEASAATTFTTRPQRSDEGASIYRFLPHTEEQLMTVREKAEAEELVQYAVHPSTGYIYGTELKDYPNTYNLMAVLSSAMPTYMSLSFKKCVPIALTTNPDAWEVWFNERRTANNNPEDDKKRLLEARQSLRWCLGQTAIYWVDNVAGEPEAAAEQIIAAMHGKSPENAATRETGQRLLDRIESLLGE